MSRATDPQRMNWLWRLVCEVANVRPAEVVEALHASRVPVDLARARSWVAGDCEEGFLPLSVAEVERNLRALVLLREDTRESGGLAAAGRDQLSLASSMPDAEPGNIGMTSGALGIADDGADWVGESTG